LVQSGKFGDKKKIPECAKDLGREQENDEDTGKKRFAPEQGQPFKIF
jgi:hypothetical protein